MNVLYMVFFLVALVLFVLDAFGVAVTRVKLASLGLAFVTLVFFLQALQRV